MIPSTLAYLLVLLPAAGALSTSTVHATSTVTVTSTTTIPPAAISSPPAYTLPPPHWPFLNGPPAASSTAPQFTYYHGCNGVVNVALPAGSSYTSTVFCYDPLSTSTIPGPTSVFPYGSLPAMTAKAESMSMGLTAAQTSSLTTSPVNAGGIINAAGAQMCNTNPGGVQSDGTVSAGCGAIFQHVMACFESLAPWSDPYDTAQSTAFQACTRQTNASTPFTSTSPLWRNFTGCSSCLQTFNTGINIDTLAQEFQSIESFCSSQNPVAYLLLADFESWLAGINKDVALTTPPLTGSITQLAALSQAFTTTPPLANLAYGASAPFDGSLIGVTPVLMTQTITVPRAGSASGSALIEEVTMIVSWGPTASTAGSPYDTVAASLSASRAVASNLESAVSSLGAIGQGGPTSNVCHGPCLKGAASQSRPTSRFAWIDAMVVLIVALVVRV
ncbi:hypothetical protein LTR53_009639 [Teratosphaeriaceae sp. CCFEE 6253]|nr:hypothetical protein LTR53_009639 [Teratosphaeriaceae sp. CCFEE 6253]